MAIPKQAAAAAAKADAMIKGANETPEEKAAREAEEAQAAEVARLAEEEAAAAAAEAEEAARLAEEEAAAKKAAAAAGSDYESQYRTLQGKYDAEVPVLYRQIAELQVKLAEITAAHKTAAAPAPAPAPTEPASLVYLRKEMPEFEDAVKYMINSTVTGLLNEKMGDVTAKVGNLENTVVENAGTAFFKYMDDNVKNWRTINDMPDFMGWLKEADRRSGRSKYDLIQEAFTSLDGPRVSTFFADFIEEEAAKKKSKKPGMEKFAAPDAGGPGDPNVGKAEITITRADITKFYNDVAKGIYKGDPESMKKRETEINAAIAAGKVA